MTCRKVSTIIVCGFLLLVGLITVLQYLASLVDWSPLRKTSFMASKKILNSNAKPPKFRLRALEAAHFDNQSDVRCVNATVGNLSFPMCVYDPKNDVHISKRVVAGKYFESDLVQKLLNLFRVHPDMTFLDLGANIGTYSLPIAHSGIHVVSVEPNKDTVRRLAKSVHLGRKANNVDIFHHALSNEESTSFLKYNTANRGDTFMAGNGPCSGCMSVEVTVLNQLIPFIRHRKAFIKVDVQEAEIKVFQRKCAAKFFDEIDVVMIQMEWVLYPKRYGTTEDGRRKVDRFLEFFYQRGYDVYDPVTERRLSADWTRWTYDVMFKKEALPRTHLFLI